MEFSDVRGINRHKEDTEKRDTKCDICGKIYLYKHMAWEDMKEVNIEENELSMTSVVREVRIVAT